jgi:arylsulfatase A
MKRQAYKLIHGKAICVRLIAVAMLVLIASTTVEAAETAAGAARRPNIVLIMADDMGYECVGANGGTSYQTPQLDRLAAGGLRFTHCHSQPICTPSRVQIMTGIYNHRNYIRFGLLDPKATTFANVLKQAGYATCIAGKWQLLGGMEGPRKFGFDEHCLWQLTRRPSRYPNPGLEINGKEVDYRNGEYGPDIASDFLCDFITRHKDGPFLAYYPMILPHWPFEPTPDSDDWDPTAKGAKGKGQNRYFADMVAYTDKMVGKIDAHLGKLGIRENTLLIFTGDNGTYTGITSKMGDIDVPGGKGSTTDNGTHAPLIVSQPGVVPTGKVCADLIDFSDILPTLADVAGAELPNNLRFDGRSFAPQLHGETAAPRRWIYCWYERNGKRGNEKQLVRNRQYKLYADGRFFDVAVDRFEKRPLKAAQLSDEVRAVHAEFQQVLDEMQKSAKKP